jgi:hypothetical protein
MIDDTMPTRRTHPGRRPSTLRMPVQAQPIDRSQARPAAAHGEGGVEADFSWTDLIPIATSALGALSDSRVKREIVPVEWTR